MNAELGVAPDGTPYLVHASAAWDAGAGALFGLVAGASFRPDGFGPTSNVAPIVAQVEALVDSLMRRGGFDADDFAARLRGSTLDPDARPVLVVPIALFHASEDDMLEAAIEALATMVNADAVTRLSAVAVAYAVAAGGFAMASAYDMAVAAVEGVERARDADDAREQVKSELRRAVTAEPTTALGRAFGHLLHGGDEVAVAIAAAHPNGVYSAALTGALLGTAHELDVFPEAWREALADAAAGVMRLMRDD